MAAADETALAEIVAENNWAKTITVLLQAVLLLKHLPAG